MTTDDLNYKQNICIDFDGVIHESTSEWTNAHDINDGPVEGAIQFIRDTMDAGFHVVIFTARARTVSVIPHIYAWLEAHGLEEKYRWHIEVTALKPSAVVYIDDHNIRFEGTFPTIEQIRKLKRWNVNAAPALAKIAAEIAAVDAVLAEPPIRMVDALSDEALQAMDPGPSPSKNSEFERGMDYAFMTAIALIENNEMLKDVNLLALKLACAAGMTDAGRAELPQPALRKKIGT